MRQCLARPDVPARRPVWIPSGSGDPRQCADRHLAPDPARRDPRRSLQLEGCPGPVDVAGIGPDRGPPVVPGPFPGPPDSGRKRPRSALETASLVELSAVCLGNRLRAKPQSRETPTGQGFCPRHTGKHSERKRRMFNRACVEIRRQRRSAAGCFRPRAAGLEAAADRPGGPLSGSRTGTGSGSRGKFLETGQRTPPVGSSSPASTGRRGREAARSRPGHGRIAGGRKGAGIGAAAAGPLAPPSRRRPPREMT